MVRTGRHAGEPPGRKERLNACRGPQGGSDASGTITMINISQRIHDFFYRDLWESDPEHSRLPPRLVRVLRLLFVLGRELVGGQLTLRAISLVYTTLLSFVPLLAVSFSVLKAFGVHNQIEPFLRNYLVAPLGPEGEEITVRILEFVENMRVGVLGSLGLLFLFFTVISLLQQIEGAFNYVWRVQRARPLSRRFSDYLSVLLIGPVLVFSAIGLTASILNNAFVQELLAIEPFGSAMLLASRIAPYLFVIAAFTFVYIFVPNTRVHWRSALVGGVVAGVIWQTTGLAFASFVAGSTRYAAIYSSFAIVFLFMFWLQLSWIILLFGSQVAYYHQHPQQIRLATGRFELSGRMKEQLGLVVMYLITERYMHGGPGWTIDSLVQRLQLPGEGVEDVVYALQRRGFLAEVEDGPFIPARDPDGITVKELREALRSVEEDQFAVEGSGMELTEVTALLDCVEAQVSTAMGDLTIKGLVIKGSAAL